MVYICCVENCKKEADPGSAITFHKFPRNLKERQKWIDVVPGKVTLTSVICSLHFKLDDFSQNVSKRYLKRHAVPSIFPGMIPKERKYLVVNQGEITLESLPESCIKDPEIQICDVRTLRENELRDEVNTVIPQIEGNELRGEVNIVTTKTLENDLRRKTIIITPKTGENELMHQVTEEVPKRKHYIVINQGEISLESFPETPDLEPESELEMQTLQQNALKCKVNSKERDYLVNSEDDGTLETLSYTSSDDESLQEPRAFYSVLTQTGPDIDIIKEEERKLKQLKKIIHARSRRRTVTIKKLKLHLKDLVKQKLKKTI
ncbi:unnamed protein product [Chilo suppressalis]|uniref:THAP-type domain-containing protein n=1 Tax=Chilo suppressalis TaxID=168631 RepID=A0ABN8AWN2_CHISP|nr:unnamed protein product [Chilo suppressalis]